MKSKQKKTQDIKVRVNLRNSSCSNRKNDQLFLGNHHKKNARKLGVNLKNDKYSVAVRQNKFVLNNCFILGTQY